MCLQPSDLQPLEEERAEALRSAQLRGWLRLLSSLDQHKALIFVAVMAATAGGYLLHQQGLFAAAAAQAQAACAAAGRLWAVIADLTRCRCVVLPAHSCAPISAFLHPSAVTLCCSRLPFPHVHPGEEGLLETIWLLLASVVTVPLICKIPGGSPVLGFLVRMRWCR